MYTYVDRLLAPFDLILRRRSTWMRIVEKLESSCNEGAGSQGLRRSESTESGNLGSEPDLSDLKATWQRLGVIDPLWAIMSDPDKRGNQWDIEDFFESGRREVKRDLAWLEALEVQILKRRALDFGCGVGRITQALCEHFDACEGVDIAPSMIDTARMHNRYPDRCTYHVIDSNGLESYADSQFDFVYSILVLQHMHLALTKKYIEEFLRVVVPGGIVHFQLPSHLPVGEDSFVTQILPDQAFRASVEIIELSTNRRAGETVKLTARVRNMSGLTWPAPRSMHDIHPIRVGLRWRDPEGNLICEGNRIALPSDLEPRQDATVVLSDVLPQVPGEYKIEVDLVQEAVTWFCDKAGTPCVETVTVEAGHGATDSTAVLHSDHNIEMHAVHRDEVLRWIESAGGRVISLRESRFESPPWMGYDYCVTKPGAQDAE